MQVERIDHVHVEVADRDVAADWYDRVMGLQRYLPLASWADDPMGPLVLATPDATPALSLFARDCRPASRDSTVAFRVSGHAFLRFLDELPSLRLEGKSNQTLTRAEVTDHQLSWSVYFMDPDGNRIEITTYDYEQIALSL